MNNILNKCILIFNKNNFILFIIKSNRWKFYTLYSKISFITNFFIKLFFNNIY